MSKSSAYTLIEILIVISIIGILMGVGLVQYRDYARRQALSSATMSMVANLRLVQEYALSGKKPATGCISLDGYRFKIVPPKYMIHAMCDDVEGPKVGDDIKVPDDITISPTGEVVFKVLGAGTKLTGDFVIKVTQESTLNYQNITITKDGKITWQ